MVLYFFLGLNSDKLEKKIFIFFISVLAFMCLTNVDYAEWFYLKNFLIRKFPFYLVSFLCGLFFSIFDTENKKGILFGSLPLLLQSLLVIGFKFNPLVVLYIVYSVIPAVYFIYLKVFNYKCLLFFLIPLALYTIFGIIAFEDIEVKIFLILLSLPLIVIIEYFVIKNLHLRRMSKS